MRRRQADFKQYPPPLLGTLQSFSKVSPKVSGSHQDDFQLTRIVFGLKKLRDPLYMALFYLSQKS